MLNEYRLDDRRYNESNDDGSFEKSESSEKLKPLVYIVAMESQSEISGRHLRRVTKEDVTRARNCSLPIPAMF